MRHLWLSLLTDPSGKFGIKVSLAAVVLRCGIAGSIGGV